MDGLADRPLSEALAALGSPSEPPAGGVACAFACAAAAALVELTAGLGAGRLSEDAGAAPEAAERLRFLRRRAGGLRERLVGLAEDDVSAYGAVAEAGDAEARASALADASEPPLAIAECAAEVADAAAEVRRAGRWSFSADASVACELAAAAALGAAELVAVDLAGEPDDPRVARARSAAERARRAGRAATEPASS